MKGWYILQVYSNQEKKVERYLRNMMESGELENVYDIKIPTKKVFKGINEKRKEVEQKSMPGYILLSADLSLVDWKNFSAKIRVIPGAGSFVGSTKNSKPMSISQEEFKNLFDSKESFTKSSVISSKTFSEGEEVRVIEGPFETFVGKVASVDENRSKLKVIVGILGRDTPVDLDFSQVEKV